MPTFPLQPWPVTEVSEAVRGCVLGFPSAAEGTEQKLCGTSREKGFFLLLRATFNELAFLKEPANIWSPAAGSALPPGSALQAVGCLGELGPAPLFHPRFPLVVLLLF